jgi:phosphomannomutase
MQHALHEPQPESNSCQHSGLPTPPSAHVFHPTVLREYDIRGIVGETLSEDDAWALGRAFATIVAGRGGSRVCVGFDGRLSSPDLEGALVDGLVAGGMTAIRIGLGPTPMLYFAVHTLDADGGIMVTGSHNPPDYNGFKMMLGKKPIFGKDVERLGSIAASGRFSSGAGQAIDLSVTDSYVHRIAEAWDGENGLTVAWDAGNGAAGDIMKRLTSVLPGRHVLLNETVDGTFPAHHPDPTVPENLFQLRQMVRDENCDIGIAFDGDRIGVVDEHGFIIWGDQLMVILADDVLRELPGSTIIADVKASRTLFDEIARRGGTPLMWRTGHSLIKTKMAECGSPLAGEMSGHIFFADRYFGFDDALYAAVRLLGILGRSSMGLADWRDAMPRTVNTPELRFDCAEYRKAGVVAEVRARLEAAGADIDTIDGVRVDTDDGWWLLRASNTQAVLVARCESSDEEGLVRLKAALASQLLASGIAAPKGF